MNAQIDTSDGNSVSRIDEILKNKGSDSIRLTLCNTETGLNVTWTEEALFTLGLTASPEAAAQSTQRRELHSQTHPG